MHMTFYIHGEPLPYREHKVIAGIWTDYKQEQLKRMIELESQMGDKKIRLGPVHIDYVFSFDVMKGRKHKLTSRHTDRPALPDLIKYINAIAKDKLYDPESVVSFAAKKIYGLESVSSFTITPVEKL